MTAHKNRWWQRPVVIAGLLFGVALLPRLPGLGTFLTSDEDTNIFFAGSDVIAAFLRGDLRGTYWHFYPGVTMSWLDAVGMVGQYWLLIMTGSNPPHFTDYLYGDILSLVVANRLPYALLTAGAVPATYLLGRQLLPARMAVLGALFMAFDPFYLAHSRVAHGDAPVTVFMNLSALTFFIYANRITAEPFSDRRIVGKPLPYLLTSAILGSLAALTKAPGQFMALFIVSLSLIYAFVELKQVEIANSSAGTFKPYPRPKGKVLIHSLVNPRSGYLGPVLSRWLTIIAAWATVSLAIFILLWPSMWIDPVGTFRQMVDETFGKVNEGHLVYFFGRPTLDPGPWFYSYVIPFRLTPIVLIGSLLSLLFFIPALKKFEYPQPNRTPLLSPLFLLWFFAITLLLFGNLSPKKQDRYLLPLFPFINLLAAVGWLNTIRLTLFFVKPKPRHSQFTSDQRSSAVSEFTISLVVLVILIVIHLIPIFTFYPYYLTYFNPLLGGPKRAAETTLMGWGEGMEQVAAYLNAKPNAQNLYVAATPSQTLLPYFVGTGENFYTNDVAFRADYVVLYLAQRQRLAPSPEIVNYFAGQEPEKTISIQGVPYASVYPGPKQILADIPPSATPINIGLSDQLRLAGYEISDDPAGDLTVTFYWHALAPVAEDYTISVRARSAGGDLLAQKDSWPVDGLLPTSLWRQGDYVADSHTLTFSDAHPNQIDRIEAVVYQLDTGQTLGPPLILDVEQGQK